MVFFLPFKRRERYGRNILIEDFQNGKRILAQYCSSIDGLEITGKNIQLIFREFFNSKRPVLHLYLPRKESEEKRDFLLKRLGRNTINVYALWLDEEILSLIRDYLQVRFGFEHQNYTYLFETKILGRLKSEEPEFLATKPDKIFQARRSHQRYQLWPEHKAYFNGIQVLNISQKGMKIFSKSIMNKNDTLEDATLILPPVYNKETGECFFPGAEIQVPRSVVSYQLKQDQGCYCGIHFNQDWSDIQAKQLNDFLLALRKWFFLSNCD